MKYLQELSAIYPQREARALYMLVMEVAFGLDSTQVLLGKDNELSSDKQALLQNIIDRLLRKEPVQYVLGQADFCGHTFHVEPGVLIPRPETEGLVRLISQQSPTPCSVLDIGTGSGCIAIALKKAHPEWQVTGMDISEEAIKVARENARRNKVEVDFRVADIFSDGIGDFDIVVSNPPYICEREKSSMRPNVLAYEPATALFVPDNDPLRFYRRIAELKLGKFLFFEINEAYPQELSDMLAELGYTDIQLTNDIYGKPRIIEGRVA